MYKIQEVVHKFRSGGGEKKDGDGGTAGRPSMSQAGRTASGASIHTISSAAMHGDSGGEMNTRWYVDPPVFSPPPTAPAQKAELSSLPLITPSGLQQTMLAALSSSDPLAAFTFPESGSRSSGAPTSPEKKLGKMRPKGTLEYKVERNDTLERIAARFDVTPSELKKLNRMSSRMVFENQVLYLPDPDYVPSDPPTPERISPPSSPPVDARPKVDIPIVKMADKPPARIPGHVMKIPSPPSSASLPKVPPHVLSEDEARQLDEECFERFIKVCAQYISEGFEKVCGTLLVTPNAIMFDPDVLDPLVEEKGAEEFGVVVYMDTIISAALYHNLSAINFHTHHSSDKEPGDRPEVYHGDSRARSKSTSALLTSKTQTSSSLPTPAAFSQSRSGVAKETSRKEAEESARETSTDPGASAIVSFSADTFRIVGDTLLRDSGITVNIDGVAGESSTDDIAPVVISADAQSQTDSDSALQREKDFACAENSHPSTQGSVDGLAGSASPNTADAGSDIAALLAGARRDSLSAEGGGKGSDAFYPSAALEGLSESEASFQEGATKKDGESEMGEDELVLKCAEKLVAEILESVTGKGIPSRSGAGGDGEPASICDVRSTAENQSQDEEQNEVDGQLEKAGDMRSKVDKKVEVAPSVTDGQESKSDGAQNPTESPPSKSEGSEGKSDAFSKPEETSQPAEHQLPEPASAEGEQLRIGSIVYLPVEETPDGAMTVDSTSANDVFDSANDTDLNFSHFPDDDDDDPPTSASNNNNPTPTPKFRPPPLTNLEPDAVDGSSIDGSRPRTASGSFSPLRSSAQHLSNLVNYATGFFRGSAEDRASVKDVHDLPVVRAGGGEDGGGGRTRKGGGGEEGGRRSWSVLNAVRAEERPELFRQVSDEDLIPPHEDVHKQPAIYLHLKVDKVECDRRVTTSAPCQSYRQQLTKPHYWFSVPRNKADHLYAFFVQWRPDLYGDEDISPEDRGFVVVDKVDLDNEQPSSLPFVDDYFGQYGSSFRKDWEIISREEARRRGSIAVDQSIMPELSQDSSILSHQHILELAESLPPRTIGYKWSLAYSTGLHGFSLKRLYREVLHIDSPILLVLQDSEFTVFGAFLSDPPKLSDHFFGTGICQLWTFKDKFRSFGWSGENAFFIKGDENSLSVGASQGLYGLWLDGDLYHGRSRQCTTFNNIVLSGSEDFCIRALEAWTFVSD